MAKCDNYRNRDAINLINRAIAALETPADLSRTEIGDLIEDLDAFAEEFRRKEK